MSTEPRPSDTPTCPPADPFATLPPRPSGVPTIVLPGASGDTATLPPRPSDSDDGSVIVPGFTILDELGRGGMGVVYRARQIELNRLVALKMVLGGANAEEKERVRFLAEAEAVAAIHHPHVVQVFEFGRHDGRPYFAMEFLTGGNLARTIGDGSGLPAARAAGILEKCARGVQAAHDLGIVHRDLKPANILLDAAGEPKVTDFGLAKRGGQADLTRTGAVMGTPAYMAPEQARGQTKFVGPAADVHALGAILFECLTGRPPFQADDTVALIMKVAQDEAPPARRLAPNVPRDLELICQKCLQKEPKDRYPAASALADDLRRYLASEPVSIRPAGAIERAIKWARRRPTLAATYGLSGLAIGLLVLVTGAVWLWQRAERARAEAEAQQILAEQAHGQAEVARGRAEAAGDELRRARDKLAVIEYGRTIQLAYDAWRNNRLAEARTLLSGCATNLRGWEWHYVNRLCHAETLVVNANGASTDGPAQPIVAVAVTPDGAWTADLDGNGRVRVWATQTGGARCTFKTPTPVAHLAFSPDGQKLVTAGGRSESVLRIWDASTGMEARALGDVWSAHAAFSPDGSRLLAVCLDATARVWDTTNWAAVSAAKCGDSEAVAFGADGPRVLLKRYPGTFFVVDASTGTELVRVNGPAGCSSLAISPNSTRIAAGYRDGMIRVWDLTNKSRLTEFRGHVGTVSAVRFSGDGKRVTTGGEDTVVRVWEAATGVAVGTLKGHIAAINEVASDTTAAVVISVAQDATARVWDPRAAGEFVSLPSAHSLPVFSPNGARFLVRQLGNGGFKRSGNEARVFNAKSNQVVATLRHPSTVLAMAFSPDGSKVVTGSNDRLARIWDAATGRVLRVLTGHTDVVEQVAFTPDGSRVVTCGRERVIRVWNSAIGEPTPGCLWSARGDRTPWVGKWAAISSDGSRALTTESDLVVRVRNTSTGEIVAELPAIVQPFLTITGEVSAELPTTPQGLLASTPNGSMLVLLASGQTDYNGLVWCPDSKAAPVDLRGHTGTIRAAAISPDGAKVLTGSADGTARCWDARTGAVLVVLPISSGQISSVAFSPDGSRILTAGGAAVRLWDVGTGAEVLSFTDRSLIAFDRGGDVLLTCDDDLLELRDARGRNSVTTDLSLPKK
jgi:eukaryotic-like serine/threonine-protein kinase